MDLHRALIDLAPRRIAIGYLVFGTVWIAVSDWLVNVFVASPGQFSQLQTIKGILFVVGSTAFIYGITRLREDQNEALIDRLEAVNQQLQVTHRVVRHDIRNHLNVIQGNVETVLDQLENESDRARLQTAHDYAIDLAETSEKLSRLQTYSRRAHEGASIDIVPVVERQVELLTREYPNRSVELAVPDEVFVRADESLHFVVGELIENSLQHGSDDATSDPIVVSVERRDDGVTCVIEDSNPRIPDYEVEALSEGELTQLVHSDGVGLWLVNWLVGVYDGSLDFEYTGSGNRVCIRLEPALDAEGVAGRRNEALSGIASPT